MPHVLVAGKIRPEGIALLAEASGVTFDYVEEVSEESYLPLLPKAEGLILRTQPLRAAAIAAAPLLCIVSRHGVGYDAVDLPALTARRIPLAVVGDANSVSVAEHAMMLLLACAKRAIRADRAVRGNGWEWRNRFEASELSCKRLLILGFGRIGRRLAHLAQAFGMEVAAHDPPWSHSGWPGGAIEEPDLMAALARADAVSLNAPKGEGPLLGRREIAALKPGAILVNTARGGAVDEAALAEALREGRIAAAGLDVFEAEPPKTDHPLFGFDQVVLSPHIAGLTQEAGRRMALSCVQNVLDFFAGRANPALIVNPDVLT
jgi:D-3-phosphoglycerate dehydrogenase